MEVQRRQKGSGKEKTKKACGRRKKGSAKTARKSCREADDGLKRSLVPMTKAAEKPSELVKDDTSTLDLKKPICKEHVLGSNLALFRCDYR